MPQSNLCISTAVSSHKIIFNMLLLNNYLSDERCGTILETLRLVRLELSTYINIWCWNYLIEDNPYIYRFIVTIIEIKINAEVR